MRCRSNERVIALDRVLANIDTSEIIPKNVEGVKADPPPIFFSKTPAVLVNIDGDPIWAPIPQNDLKSAVNTNWDLFEHGPTKTYYLRDEEVWLKATDVKGPWGPAGTLPESFKKLPADDNWKEVKASLPGKTVERQQGAEGVRQPGAGGVDSAAEASQAIWPSQGAHSSCGSTTPRATCSGWASTARSTSSSPAAGSRRPTSPARGRLRRRTCRRSSSRFRSSTSARACSRRCRARRRPPKPCCSRRFRRRRASARRAGARGRRIRAARRVQADRDDDGAACGQHRQGHPQGRRPLLHVLPGRVVHVEAATGPWTVTGEVPKQIYEIPVSSPAHAVTYVTVEESNDDAVVFATAAAFTGVMVAWGCVGLGHRLLLSAVLRVLRRLPVLLPALSDLRVRRRLQPVDRRVHARGGGLRSVRRRRRCRPLQPGDRYVLARRGGLGSVRRARAGEAYNPRTGTYSRGAVAYGPYGARGAAQAYNPRTGAYGATRQGSNVYGSWGATGVQRGDQWATTSPATNNATGNTTRTAQGARAAPPSAAAGRRGPLSRSFAKRRRLRRPRWQRLPQRRRQLAEVRQRRLEQRADADAVAGAVGGERPRRGRRDQFVEHGAVEQRLEGPR